MVDFVFVSPKWVHVLRLRRYSAFRLWWDIILFRHISDQSILPLRAILISPTQWRSQQAGESNWEELERTSKKWLWKNILKNHDIRHIYDWQTDHFESVRTPTQDHSGPFKFKFILLAPGVSAVSQIWALTGRSHSTLKSVHLLTSKDADETSNSNPLRSVGSVHCPMILENTGQLTRRTSQKPMSFSATCGAVYVRDSSITSSKWIGYGGQVQVSYFRRKRARSSLILNHHVWPVSHALKWTWRPGKGWRL